MLFTAIKQGRFESVPTSPELQAANLIQVAVGDSRDALMNTSPTQSVVNVCETFGKFVKFTVEVDGESCSSTTHSTTSVTNPTSSNNAFQVLMAAQQSRQLGDNGLPFAVNVKTNKDRLYNNLISLMKELGIKWNDPKAYGEPFLKRLCDVLWYIDGHHHTIAEHSPNIPSLLSNFTGYNCPQLHKHRKRTLTNLKSSDLHSYAAMLLDSLQTSWMKKDAFLKLREAVEGLLKCLKSHATYLDEKCKYQKLHHLMDHPSATPDDRAISNISSSQDMPSLLDFNLCS